MYAYPCQNLLEILPAVIGLNIIIIDMIFFFNKNRGIMYAENIANTVYQSHTKIPDKVVYLLLWFMLFFLAEGFLHPIKECN